jgi:hypothetical protein
VGIQVKIIEPGGVDTDFGGRSMDFALDESLTEYSDALAKFQSRMAESGLGRSTAEYLAEQIFVAATDGTTQMRYLIGDDAIQTYGMREQVGDDAFMAGMKERMFA